MTGDAHLRRLAADFCLSACGAGTIERVEGATEILHKLLMAARDAGGDVAAAARIEIDWKAQFAIPSTRGGGPMLKPEHVEALLHSVNDDGQLVLIFVETTKGEGYVYPWRRASNPNAWQEIEAGIARGELARAHAALFKVTP